jgi:hypothetical protein
LLELPEKRNTNLTEWDERIYQQFNVGDRTKLAQRPSYGDDIFCPRGRASVPGLSIAPSIRRLTSYRKCMCPNSNSRFVCKHSRFRKLLVMSVLVIYSCARLIPGLVSRNHLQPRLSVFPRNASTDNRYVG